MTTPEQRQQHSYGSREQRMATTEQRHSMGRKIAQNNNERVRERAKNNREAGEQTEKEARQVEQEHSN